MRLIVQFKDTEPIKGGWRESLIDVYFRGQQVGKISKIELSKDQKYVLYHMDIYYEGLRLPKNTEIIVQNNIVLGGRYVDLNYPDNPSTELLKDGDVVDGFDPSSIRKLNVMVAKMIESGQIDELIKVSDTLLREFNSFVNSNSGSLSKLLHTLLTSSDDKLVPYI